MSLPIRFRPLASRELDDAVGWYEKQRPGLGLELKAEVDNFLNQIAENPTRFRCVRGNVRWALLRRFPYSIHFLEESETIIVSRSSMDTAIRGTSKVAVDSSKRTCFSMDPIHAP